MADREGVSLEHAPSVWPQDDRRPRQVHHRTVSIRAR